MFDYVCLLLVVNVCLLMLCLFEQRYILLASFIRLSYDL